MYNKITIRQMQNKNGKCIFQLNEQGKILFDYKKYTLFVVIQGIGEAILTLNYKDDKGNPTNVWSDSIQCQYMEEIDSILNILTIL